MASVRTPLHAFPAASLPWDANVLPVPSPPPGPLLPQRRLIPAQQRVHAVGPQNAMFLPVNAADNRHHDGDREGISLPVENNAVRGQPQDHVHNDMNYDMGHYPPPSPADFLPPHEYHDHVVNYAGVAQGVPVQAQIIAPPAPEINLFHYADQHGPADPAQAFLDEWHHRVPDFNDPARELLRRLANRYLNEPDSQVDVVRIEPGRAGGIRVVITLDLADLL